MQGFAEFFYFGKERHYVLVMDLLGQDLEQMVEKCKGSFDEKTTALVAEQVNKGLRPTRRPENYVFYL